MNDTLSQDFNTFEIHLGLKYIAPSKAPGPDGMLIFFTKNIGVLWGLK